MPSIKSVSAGDSTVSASPLLIADDGVESSVVTLTLLDTNSDPLIGVAAEECVLAVTGTGNTLTQPTGFTDASGVITGSFVSTVAEAKVASFTVAGLAITDTAAVTVNA